MPILASLIAVAEPAEPVWKSDNYEVTESILNTCSLFGAFQNRKTHEVISIGILYSHKPKSIIITFQEQDSTSLPENGSTELTISLYSSLKKKVIFAKDVKFDFNKAEKIDGRESIHFTALLDESSSSALISWLPQASVIAFFKSNQMVEAFPLEEPVEAQKMLKGCAMKKIGLNPDDPFAQ